jgi:hypothetical protein
VTGAGVNAYGISSGPASATEVLFLGCNVTTVAGASNTHAYISDTTTQRFIVEACKASEFNDGGVYARFTKYLKISNCQLSATGGFSYIQCVPSGSGASQQGSITGNQFIVTDSVNSSSRAITWNSIAGDWEISDNTYRDFRNHIIEIANSTNAQVHVSGGKAVQSSTPLASTYFINSLMTAGSLLVVDGVMMKDSTGSAAWASGGNNGAANFTAAQGGIGIAGGAATLFGVFNGGNAGSFATITGRNSPG